MAELREKLLALKRYCAGNKSCHGCKYEFFKGNRYECRFMDLNMSDAPEHWNVEEIVREIDGIH